MVYRGSGNMAIRRTQASRDGEKSTSQRSIREIQKTWPALIIQNDISNRLIEITIVGGAGW